MPARRLIVLLCLTGATTTVSIGAFPALLPELGMAGRLADWQIGALAGTFGLARMLSNLPVGLFITHHLGRALILAPGLMLGATDSKHYAGLTDRVYRFNPMRLAPGDPPRLHGVDDRIAVADLHDAVEFYVRLLMRFATATISHR